jgi:HEXXH motif-containing protein
VLVPLIDRGDGAARSGTARDSIGALGLTPPLSPTDLAITLVHEFQHSKLTAVLDLVPLYVPGGSEMHFAPWRTDPRPTGGLIQGVYAFLGVADVWRGLRAAPGLEKPATEQFAIVREQVRAGLAALERSTELTQEGVSFVAGMRSSLNRLNADGVPDSVLDLARSALTERRTAWQERLRA